MGSEVGWEHLPDLICRVHGQRGISTPDPPESCVLVVPFRLSIERAALLRSREWRIMAQIAADGTSL